VRTKREHIAVVVLVSRWRSLMNLPLGRPFRLVDYGGPGLSCDENGVALGKVQLVWRSMGDAPLPSKVRPLEGLSEVIRLAYGAQSPDVIRRCHRGLARVAARLDSGDLTLAALEAVMIGSPDLAPPAMAKLAKLADLEKAGTAWEDQPRVPAGEHGGGQWTAEGGQGRSGSTVSSELCAPTHILTNPADDLLPVRGPPAPQTPEITQLEELATAAAEEVPRNVPPLLRGFRIHLLFEAEVAEAFGPDHAEASYLDGEPTSRGRQGSSRADAIIGPIIHPLFAVELKTGNAQITRGQLRRYGRNLPPGTPVIVIRLEATDE
jgi:hypothetical protein